MFHFLLRRTLLLIPTLLVIALVTFIVIELPPGDFADSQISQLLAQGENVSPDQIAAFKARFGYGLPVHVRFAKWFGGVLQGDFGYSFEWNKSVNSLIWERLALTFALALFTLLLTWVIALPIGIYSALRKYTVGDYIVTFVNFLGIATPDFLLALVLIWIAFSKFGMSAIGLFSEEFADAAWNLGKVIDLLNHLWIPAIIVGLSSTASLVRIMRANLLDELPKLYVTTARAKGLPEWKVILKYPVRVALIPFVATVGWSLPGLISGATIVSVVLNLPTNGPLLLRALLSQDMYLAGSFVFILSLLTVVGTLISDMLLAWLDPRIRLE